MPNPVTEINLEEPVAQHMRTELARLQVHLTVGEALDAVRQSPPPARIVYFYVVDDAQRLVGVIPARAMLLSPPETRLSDIMIRNVIALPDDATVLDACEFFVLHRFLAFPVIDRQRRLIGAIDVELYTDELRDLGAGLTDDLFQLIGVHLARAKHRNPWTAFRSRFPWLMCNVTGGVAAAFLSGIFQAELERVVALALFIPVVLALAESVSIQSLSLSLQILRGQTPTWPAIVRRLRRELVVGLLLGVASGLVVGLVALFWRRHLALAACTLGGIATGVAAAAIFGAMVPNLLRRLKLDPQVAAGPVILATTDVVTLMCYFNLARWLLP
ncbi:MAG: magnesium transporter [Thermoguttaceae bacterium]